MLSRRSFLGSTLILYIGTVRGVHAFFKNNEVMTVIGPIDAGDMGHSLIHEHILVDFIGAENYDPHRWNREDVIKKAMPFLIELKLNGCKTLVDCTPAYLGRDAKLLQQLSKLSGLHILTNTGYYGGSDNRFLPSQAFTETAPQLANRWIKESRQGIDGTNILPGFIKISVNNSQLSAISKKLISAAAYCHLESGLTIASHTGPAIPAFEELAILKQLGVAPNAFIWVHAQNEKDWKHFLSAVKQGAWVSLDGLNENNVSQYVNMLTFLKNEQCLHRILISQDAGWYEPGKPDGGKFRGYTTLFEKLIPALKQALFTESDIDQLMKDNPAKAFTRCIRKV